MKTNETILSDFLVNQYLKRQNTSSTRAIPSKDILKFISANIDKINGYLGIDIKIINDVKLRELINWIRKEKICKHGELLSNSRGYFLSTDKDEILEYLQSWEDRLSIQYKAIRSIQSRTSNYKSGRGIVSVKVNYKDKKSDGLDLFDTL